MLCIVGQTVGPIWLKLFVDNHGDGRRGRERGGKGSVENEGWRGLSPYNIWFIHN